MLLLPVGGLALTALALRTRAWPEMTGIGAGLAGLLLVVAYTNRSYTPCLVEPTTVTRTPGYRPPICGGMDPIPWLVVGVLLMMIAVGTYAILHTREHRARTS